MSERRRLVGRRMLGWTAFGLLAAGCAPQVANDPLTGGGPAVAAAASRGPTAAGTATADRGNAPGTVPSVPSPTSSGSPAALASGNVRTLDPSRDLRIGSGGPTTAPTWAKAGTTGPVTLQGPQPAAGNGAPTLQLTSGNAAPGFDQLKAQLQSRGVVWMRLDVSAESGETKFSCSMPSKTNANARRTYEATARDEVAAMRAVIEKIDAER